MKNWLRTKLKNFLYSDDSLACVPIETTIRDNSIDIDGLAFNVMAAQGGVILQSRKYERKTDRHSYSTYIINDDEDVAVRIGQIISIELLKL